MKKILLFFLFLPLLTLAQKTYVPDDNFENYLESNNMGDGIWGNDSVLTANINTVTFMDASAKQISDFTGIENFIALENLSVSWNFITNIDFVNSLTNLTTLSCAGTSTSSITLSLPNLIGLGCGDGGPLAYLDVKACSNLISLYCPNALLTSLDVSGLSNLKYLVCHSNNISNLDITGCIALEELNTSANNLTTIDLSTNISLKEIICSTNSITHLDVSNCPNIKNTFTLDGLVCDRNKLTYLNLQNGDPTGPPCDAVDNPDLTCVMVNDVAYANANFDDFDNGVYFDTYCPPYVSTNEIDLEDVIKTDKTLIRIVDILGRETKAVRNNLLFYIYNDGTVEKKLIVK